MITHPYRGANLFDFFIILFKRLLTGFSGAPLATDEIQFFVLGGIAISAALVGSLLVLRKMTMLANSLSHTILLGLVLAVLACGGIHLGGLLVAAVLTALSTTLLTLFLQERARLKADASIGLVFTTLFALAILLVTLFTRNLHLGIEAVTGNVDALTGRDALLVGAILLFNLLFTLLFFRPYHLTSFDPGFAFAAGLSQGFFNALLMVQVGLTLVGGFRAVGVLMVLALLVGPPLAARPWVKSLKGMMVLSSLLGLLAALLGVATARHLLSVHGLPLSTAGVTVCWIGALTFLSWGLRRFRLDPTSDPGYSHP
ncbi:MAG: metal ABC transporter permease [Parachlamydiales bacterium]